MIRLRQRSSGTYPLSVTTIDDAGAALTVTAPASVSVYDSAGTAVVDAATPDITADAMSYSADVAVMPQLDTYRATFTGTVGSETVEWVLDVELVGGYLFSLADLRARDSSFVDDVKYPDALLALARIQAEQTIEGPHAARVAFVPRGRRVTIDGTGRAGIRLPDYEIRAVYSASIDGAALSTDEVAALILDDGVIWLPSGVWRAGRRNVTVHYQHGLDFPPGPITRAGLTLAREYLVDPQLDLARATATTVGDQMFRLTIAGRDGVTGLPEVDAAIEQHGRSRLLMG